MGDRLLGRHDLSSDDEQLPFGRGSGHALCVRHRPAVLGSLPGSRFKTSAAVAYHSARLQRDQRGGRDFASV